jgi:hypothetical protein
VETNKFNHLTIQQYLEGKLDDKAMHELEKQALDDPFFADALEGYAQAKLPAGKQLSILQAQLQERIAQQQENKNVFHFSWQRLSVAAAACLLFVMASVLFLMRQQHVEKRLASRPRSIDVALTPIDSIPGRESVIAAVPGDEINSSTSGSANLEKSVSKDYASVAASKNPKKAKPDLNDPLIMAKGSSTAAVQNSDQALIKPQGEGAHIASRAKRADNEGSISGLNEVVVNTAPAINPDASQPLIGWDMYNKYLQDNIRKAVSEKVTGSVVLYFNIAKDGKPLDILVRKGLTPAANLEAMRLIKEGPLWQPRQDSTATVIVRFGK